MTAEGRLPPGRHPATLDEVFQRFVDDAPHAEHRGRIFRALEVYLDRLVELAGPGTVWLDGGFVTHKDAPPHDVDLAYLCRDAAHLEALLRTDGVLELVTLQDVAFWKPFAASPGESNLSVVGSMLSSSSPPRTGSGTAYGRATGTARVRSRATSSWRCAHEPRSARRPPAAA